jgi:ribonuclease HII
MLGRSWKKVEDSVAEKVKPYLLERGGEEQEVKSANEKWRIRFSDSTITYYVKGTLFSTPSVSNDPAVLEAWQFMESLTMPYVPPTKDLMIGLDETGKGEVIGHLILTGLIFPKEIYGDVNLIVGPADTKKGHDFEYWDELFKAMDSLRKAGLNFIVEKIPPWVIDKYNINKIMDVTYQRILNAFFREQHLNKCRIVVDDYGVGPTLRRFLNFLEKQGAEIVVASRADEDYLEAKAASLVSKRIREGVMKSIRENPDFKIDGLSVGSGNAGDKETAEWLAKWYSERKTWPWFVKRSYSTIFRIEGKTEGYRKLSPPIREELLSKEFLTGFNNGHLSIQALSIVCPSCGSILKSATFVTFDDGIKKVSALKCPSCNKPIQDAGFTLKYYCGYVVPDSSAIQRGLICNDLSASRFFEDFTIVLPPIVRKECNGTPRSKTELEGLWKYHSMGRIKLASPGSVREIPDDLPSEARDEKIIETSLKYDAILLTADKSMNAFASGKNVFTIFI